MADVKTLLADPRRRNLAVLAAIALASILLAFLGLEEQAAEVAPRYAPREFFPRLAAQIHDAARIHVVSRKFGAFDAVFKPIKGWVLPEKYDYPASFAEVNKTLVGLAALETIEPKTARADWLHYIDLDAPEKGGAGVEIAVSDEHGRVLAALIAGKSEDIASASGAVGLFVRRPGDSQSWLVRSELEPRSDPNDWIDKNVVDIDRSRIQETVVDQPDGQSYKVHRDKPGDADFKLVAIPKGREMAEQAAPDSVAAAIVGFTFDDVKPAKNVDFSDAYRIVTKTFDGLSVTVDVVHQGTEYWAELGAMSLLNKPEVGKQARTIGMRVSGWAYKLPDYKGAQFMTSLESLLKPKGKAKK